MGFLRAPRRRRRKCLAGADLRTRCCARKAGGVFTHRAHDQFPGVRSEEVSGSLLSKTTIIAIGPDTSAHRPPEGTPKKVRASAQITAVRSSALLRVWCTGRMLPGKRRADERARLPGGKGDPGGRIRPRRGDVSDAKTGSQTHAHAEAFAHLGATLAPAGNASGLEQRFAVVPLSRRDAFLVPLDSRAAARRSLTEYTACDPCPSAWSGRCWARPGPSASPRCSCGGGPSCRRVTAPSSAISAMFSTSRPSPSRPDCGASGPSTHLCFSCSGRTARRSRTPRSVGTP